MKEVAKLKQHNWIQSYYTIATLKIIKAFSFWLLALRWSEATKGDL